MKKLTTAMLLSALCTVPAAYADTRQPTVENAHAFIKDMAEKTNLYGLLSRWDGRKEEYINRPMENIKSQDCNTSYSLRSWDGSYRYDITIRWDEVSTVSTRELSAPTIYHYVIAVVGGISGAESNSQILIAVSPPHGDDVKERLIKAMNFLSQQCGGGISKYGF